MKITHVSLMVKNQDEALAFFVKKLGYEKREDNPMGQDRWLTVGCPGQALEIVLQMPHWGPEKASTKEREAMIGKQSFCFASTDIQADYKQLTSQGVTVLEPPTQYPWGHQLIFADLYGNAHVLVATSK